jgi:hypothetical protein
MRNSVLIPLLVSLALISCGRGDRPTDGAQVENHVGYTIQEYEKDQTGMEREEQNLEKVGLKFVTQLGSASTTNPSEAFREEPSVALQKQKAALKNYVSRANTFLLKYDRPYYVFRRGIRILSNWDGRTHRTEKNKFQVARQKLTDLERLQ